MPDDKLQTLLMNRPVTISGDVQYPKVGDPGVVDDKVMRALGVATGIDDQQPGDLAGALGATLGAVSLIPPGVARLRGAQMVERMRKLEKAPPQMMEALEFAQKRWPRMFGHIQDITMNPKLGGDGVAYTSTPAEAKAMKTTYPGMAKQEGRFSKIEINPKAHPTKEQAVETIAHEMLHAADKVVNPEFMSQYMHSTKLPGSYNAASQELRAKLQGAKARAYIMGIPKGDFEVATSPTSTDTDIIPKLDNRISNIDMPLEKPIFEDPKDKIMRIVQERILRRAQGIKDPRVPIVIKDQE